MEAVNVTPLEPIMKLVDSVRIRDPGTALIEGSLRGSLWPSLWDVSTSFVAPRLSATDGGTEIWANGLLTRFEASSRFLATYCGITMVAALISCSTLLQ